MGEPSLFSPLSIGPKRLKNRVVALPVFTGYANPDGTVSRMLLSHYAKIAGSGAAMVVVANTAVAADAMTSRYNLRIDADRYIPGLKKLAHIIRRQGALACIQLNHAGRFAKTAQPLLASPIDASNLTYNLSALKDFIHSFAFEHRLALTRFFLKQFAAWRRAVRDEDLNEVISRFAAAAMRAREAGFDVIELHGANGYLLCEFLSPATNKRPSVFGGSFNNRMAFPLAVVNEIRRNLPMEVPLGFRLLLNEWVPGGIELKESVRVAEHLEKAGVNYLSAAAGTFNSIFRPRVMQKISERAYLREEMLTLKRHVAIPVIISGRVTTPALANTLLAQHAADLIGLGRPLRVDPSWIKTSGHPTHKLKLCINCNTCLKSVVLERGFVCRQWSGGLQRKTDLGHLMLTRNYKGLWVICDGDDLTRFKAGLPSLLPAGRWRLSRHTPTPLFLCSGATDGCAPAEKADFVSWLHRREWLAENGHCAGTSAWLEKTAHGPFDSSVKAEIDHGRYGLVLMGRDRFRMWQTRLIYHLRHKVVGLVSPNPRLHEVAVLLDFSESSLLIMSFLRYAHGTRPKASLHFLHAFNGALQKVEKRWDQLKQAVNFRKDFPLKRIDARGNAAAALIEEINAGPYGTIIMGKRGLSGIKHLLPGSVSRSVLRDTDDHSIFLID